MEILCPYCGNIIQQENICSVCHSNIEWVNKIYNKSNLYYIKGYYCAKNRELSKAVMYLKRATFFNKFNTQARNLLGLVYFQRGDIGEALKQWIISISLDKNDNRAKQYLAKMQNTMNHFEEYKDAIMLYNRALRYVKQKNNDMAIIRLKKAVSLNPRFLDARCLLALCYMKQKDYYKAQKEIFSVLEVDQSHEKALRYLNQINNEDTRKKTHDLVVDRVTGTENETIQKPNKIINRGYYLRNYVIYFVVGAVCMLIIQLGLIYPNINKNLNQKIKQHEAKQIELTNDIEKITSETDQKIKQLQEENEKLKTENSSLKANTDKLTQQQKLVAAKELSEQRKWKESAEVIYTIAASVLDDDQKQEYEELKITVYKKAAEEFYYEGNRLYNNKDFINARVNLEKAMLFMSDPYISRKTLYYMGLIEEHDGNIEKAKHYYNLLITNYSGTKEANSAKNNLSGM
jgi:tetratricopeptide (TPR) repeat protein